MSLTVIVAGLVILMILVLLPVIIKARRVDLTQSGEGKPEWMHAMPPAESVAASMKDGKGVTLYDYDEGEHLAAPFAEQIEDMLRAKLENDPVLKSFSVDFGTGKNGGLDIWVNGEKYESVDKLPNEHLKQVFRQAVREWNARK